MKTFDYSVFPEALLTAEISNLPYAIHEYRWKQDLYITAPKDILGMLLEAAIIQSTDASNYRNGQFLTFASNTKDSGVFNI